MAPAEEFDHTVTGTGSAGCAVAARLSQSGQYRVLLPEAGPPNRNPWVHLQMGFSRLFADPAVNWMYESEPEPQLAGRSMYSPLGKVLGRTKSIDGMVYMRGNRADYQGGANEYHGVGGHLTVTEQPNRYELAEKAIAAMLEDARATA